MLTYNIGFISLRDIERIHGGILSVAFGSAADSDISETGQDIECAENDLTTSVRYDA